VEPLRNLIALKEIKRMIIDRAQSMNGKTTGLMGRIRLDMAKHNPKFYMELHCLLHQLSLCKIFKV
jgi:hypothetical protein